MGEKEVGSVALPQASPAEAETSDDDEEEDDEEEEFVGSGGHEFREPSIIKSMERDSYTDQSDDSPIGSFPVRKPRKSRVVIGRRRSVESKLRAQDSVPLQGLVLFGRHFGDVYIDIDCDERESVLWDRTWCRGAVELNERPCVGELMRYRDRGP